MPSNKKRIDEWDAKHSWHPFTQMEEYLAGPRIHVERGEGCWLWDSEGNRYLDTNASVWTNVHGHNDSELNQALTEQLEQVAHSTYLGLSHTKGAQLGEKLVSITPSNLQRVVFSDNGSNAVEIALKLSMQHWQLKGEPKRVRIIGMAGGYHGDTVGTMAVGQSGRFHERFSEWFLPTSHFPAPECEERGGRVFSQNSQASLAALEALLKTEGEQTCAVILEPSVQGAAGMQLLPPGFLREVEALCRRYEVHLILDEVFVAFGRLGVLSVCESEGVKPDFLCLAKGLTAGYLPLAATLVASEIYDSFLGPFHEDKTFFHGHTFTANPLAAAVALKSIEKLEALIASGQLVKTITYFSEAIVSQLEGHPRVRGIRQRGLAAAVDLFAGAGKEPWAPERRMGWQLCLAARKHGLLLRPIGDSLMIVPPIVIQESEIDFLFERLNLVLNQIT